MSNRISSVFLRRLTSLTPAFVIATTITACSDDAVTVPPPPPIAVSLFIIPASVNLLVGQSTILSHRAVDEKNRFVSTVAEWTSDNPGIATIGLTDGRVTAIAPGIAYMTAAAGTLRATAAVIVQKLVPTTIRLSTSEVVVGIGSTERVTALVLDQNGGNTNALVTWSSQNPSVASVSGDGTVTGTSLGTTVVVAASEGVTAQATVRVEPAGFLMQWARSATASSQYASDLWAPAQATGTPNVFQCDDEALAWASLDGNTVEWLELHYDQPVRPTEIRIHEVWAPGSIVKIEVKDQSGAYHQVYSASPQIISGCLRMLNIPVTGVTEYISTVRVTIDQRQRNDWNEIDAVRLTGFRRP